MLADLHVHTGPGHHDRIFLDQLRRHKVNFTYTKYHPTYMYGVSSAGEPLQVLDKSSLYEFVNKIVWGGRSKLPVLRKTNWHYDITYPLYDKITARKLNKAKIFWGWPQMSLACFEKNRKLGGINVLDYPIPHIRTWQNTLLEEQAMLNSKILPHSLFSDRTYHRMLKEIELADYISVPSLFVKESFLENGVPEEKLLFNSYGIDTSLFHPSDQPKQGNFKVIFVGTIELRKGVHYLIQAFEKLKLPEIELRLIGKVCQDFQEIQRRYQQDSSVQWLGQLTREETAREMREADIMVMPSLLEGLSLTILECMASGTPVISSTHAGGRDVILEEEDGYLFEAGDSEELKFKLEKAYAHKQGLKSMGINCSQRVNSAYTVNAYGDRIVHHLKNTQRG